MATTNINVSRTEFIEHLKTIRQQWIDDFDAEVAKRKAHNDALPAELAKWWREVKKAVKEASADFAKSPGPDKTWAHMSGEGWSQHDARVYFTVPMRPTQTNIPARDSLDYHLRRLDNDIRLLEMGTDEKIRLNADLRLWLDPEVYESSRIARW